MKIEIKIDFDATDNTEKNILVTLMSILAEILKLKRGG